MNRALGLFLLAVLLGCSARSRQIERNEVTSPPPAARRALVRDNNQQTMEEIAIAELSARKGKPLKRKELEVSSVRVGQDWHVTITPLPAKPGGFNTVILSQQGEVKAIVGGE